MKTKIRNWWMSLAMLVLVAGGWVVAWRGLRQVAEGRRGEIAALREALRDEAAVRSEHERLTTAQVSPAERERLRADRAALPRLRAEVEALRERILMRERTTGGAATHARVESRPTATVERATTAELNPARENRDPEKGLTEFRYFKDVGSASPAAAFQTLVWAATNLEDKRLGALLALNEGDRRDGEELWQRLSGELQGKFPTVERMFGFVLVNAAFGGRAEILGSDSAEAANSAFQLGVKSSNGSIDWIPMERSAEGWRLVVRPGSVKTTMEANLAAALNEEMGRKRAVR